MKELKVLRGDELLDLEGENRYTLQATIKSVTVFNLGAGQTDSVVDRNVSILHHEFDSSKTPREAAEEMQAFLKGFEVASVRFDAQERISKKIKSITVNRVENAELFVYTRLDEEGWLHAGEVEIPYDSQFDDICKAAADSPHRLTSWGSF
ncbi:hypothetical protein MYX07_06450 [Patescibacteria group bacterium AH-259-L07]|nr:hypothetical protein [Patescibacteria group bacterium AH-259-L07]